MRWFSKVVYSFKSFFLRTQWNVQLTEEIRTHLEMQMEAKVATRLSLEKAREAALQEFGNVARIPEKHGTGGKG